MVLLRLGLFLFAIEINLVLIEDEVGSWASL